jgi:Repeat of Unknown Function (DUF347)
LPGEWLLTRAGTRSRVRDQRPALYGTIAGVAQRLGASPVLTFWAAYILTRPIGASFADFFGMAKGVSGMGFGHGAVSVVTLVLVVASFIYLSRSRIDQPVAAPSLSPAVPSAGERELRRLPVCW